jgi:hypothetical protein
MRYDRYYGGFENLSFLLKQPRKPARVLHQRVFYCLKNLQGEFYENKIINHAFFISDFFAVFDYSRLI